MIPNGQFAVELDFAARSQRPVLPEDVAASLAGGRFVWIDLEGWAALDAWSTTLEDLRIPSEVLRGALAGGACTRHFRYPSCLHLTLSGCRLDGALFVMQRVDVAIGENYLITIHPEQVEFIELVKQHYADDFLHHAQTPSFLIYELWGHLIDRYTVVHEQLEERVSAIQSRLIERVDDALFGEIAHLSSDLVQLRKVLLPARTLLTDMASRKSRFVSSATQPFLANMVGTLDRLSEDLLADREILSDSLNLHVSAVSHRTNEVMRRLTIVSVLFLPLTFLVGVYGMNFKQPELAWEHGYTYFWIIAIATTIALLALLRNRKLL